MFDYSESLIQLNDSVGRWGHWIPPILWKAFGSVSCKIFKDKLLKYGLDKHGSGLKTVEHLGPKHSDQRHKVWLEASARQCISGIHTGSSPLQDLINNLGEVLKKFTICSTKQIFGLRRGKRENLEPPANPRYGNAGQLMRLL